MRLQKLLTDLKERKKDNKGMALVSTIVVMLVLMLVVVALVGTTVFSLRSTINNRAVTANVAKAESVRDEVMSKIINGTCEANGTSAEEDTEKYSWYIVATASETPPNSANPEGSEQRCPTANDKYIVINVTAGDTTLSNSRVISSAYEWSGRGLGNGYLPSAMLIDGGAVLQGYKVSKMQGVLNPSIFTVNNGIFECFTGADFNANLLVTNGNVDLLDGCQSSTGSISANGQLNGVLKEGHVFTGDVCATGAVNYPENKINGKISFNQEDCPNITNPGWVNYNPDLTGATVVADPSLCVNALEVGDRGILVEFLEALEVPTTIDATTCPEVLRMLNVQGGLKVKTDITLVANNVNIGGTSVVSADGKNHKFNIIIPDRNPETDGTPAPTCSPGQSFKNSQGAININLDEKISGVIYTPCEVEALTGNWNGQIYVGGVTGKVISGTFNYRPVLLDGFPIEEKDKDAVVPLIFPTKVWSKEGPVEVNPL